MFIDIITKLLNFFYLIKRDQNQLQFYRVVYIVYSEIFYGMVASGNNRFDNGVLY